MCGTDSAATICCVIGVHNQGLLLDRDDAIRALPHPEDKLGESILPMLEFHLV
jgi:hypothetical protein